MPRTKTPPVKQAGATKKKGERRGFPKHVREAVAAQAPNPAPASDRGATSQPAAKAPDAKIADAFASWKGGEQISVLASKIGVKRSKLRRHFIQLAGGKPAFKSLRETGAGGSAEPFGGKRATGRVVGAIAPTIDDSKVPRIKQAPTSEGWTWRRLRPHGDDLIFISPDGVEYVRALPSQTADLIHDGTLQHGLNAIRLRKLDVSKVAKKERKQEKTIERGEIAIKRTRERKRKAKLARRGKVKA